MILVSQNKDYTINMQHGYVEKSFLELFADCTGKKVRIGKYESMDRTKEIFDDLTKQMIAGVEVYRMPEV